MDKIIEFTNAHLLLVTGLFVSFFVLVFSEIRRKASDLVNVEPVEAVRLINNDATVIDLRSAEAFAGGHIVNARNIPFDELEGKQGQIENLKTKPVVAVCQAGITSTKAINTLKKSGFENVFGLKGGMASWSQAGLPVVSGKKTKSKDKQKGKGKKQSNKAGSKNG
ncbi:MAG: rhodanese-like domain-containing protein [Woeseiaceae bacterium]